MHSKYFTIEENQICIDSEGNIKVWVNPDLSINYPNFDSTEQSYGEQQMVEQLVRIIAMNTDAETEPTVGFEYRCL